MENIKNVEDDDFDFIKIKTQKVNEDDIDIDNDNLSVGWDGNDSCVNISATSKNKNKIRIRKNPNIFGRRDSHNNNNSLSINNDKSVDNRNFSIQSERLVPKLDTLNKIRLSNIKPVSTRVISKHDNLMKIQNTLERRIGVKRLERAKKVNKCPNLNVQNPLLNDDLDIISSISER